MLQSTKVILSATILTIAVSVLFGATSDAVSGASWRPGYIIDNSLMYTPSDMTVGSISSFLSSKVPVCDTDGTQPYAGTTRAAYGASRGYPAPYTCLKDYTENVATRGADAYCSGIGGGWKSSSSIIYEVAHACNISSKVLLVMLEKEQGLISDDWPWSIQYRGAMGYGCPDTEACDSQYYGFFNQVYNAARQFKVYAANQSSYRYKPYQTNFIQWNPNSGCGGSNVYIENLATAGLYNYTPYQPNSAALNNLYGSGDSCSAYGNRNFWRLYNDWFGTTEGIAYSWEWAGQQAYTNSSMTVTRDLGAMRLGEQAYLSVRAKNTGTATWTNSGPNPVRIGTTSPTGRNSVFSPFSGWLSPARPAQLQEASVAPGDIGTFNFWITANATGLYNERFNLLAENLAWFNDIGLSYGIGVVPDIYSWSWNSQYAYTDATKTIPRALSNLKQGEKVYVGFTARNTGNVTWTNSGPNPVRVGTASPNERSSSFSYASGWLGNQRPAVMRESSVTPGNVGTFEFWITANELGTYNERFNLLAEGKTWFNDLGLSYGISVRPDNYSWSWNSQYAFTDATKTIPKNLQTLQLGEKAFVGLTAKNTGNTTWTNSGLNPVRMGTAAPNERLSSFSHTSGWLSDRRTTVLKENSVPPGSIGTFEFWITGNQAGTYNERFNLLSEGRTWFNDLGLSYGIKVNP